MSRVLIAWELGHGLGHLSALKTLAVQLVDQGHEVSVAARDLPRTHAVFDGSGCRVLCAPFFPGVVIPSQQVNSLADVIWYESGGHTAAVFSSLFLGWRGLIEVLGVDLVIADAAQVALASSAGQVSTLNFVHYFHATDARSWTVFRDWEPVDQAACRRRADLLLGHLNEARQAVGLSAVDALDEGFGADRQAFRCLPELDPFGPRQGVDYLGQMIHSGQPAEWPVSASRRVFVYLRADYEHLDRVLGALQRLDDAAVLCFHNGIDERKLKAAPHLRYSSTPYDLSTVMPECDAVVCHGGGVHALAAQFGKPTLLMPLHTEHFLSARASLAAGLSRVISPLASERPNFLAAIREILADGALRDRALAVGEVQASRIPDPAKALMDAVNSLL